MSRQRICGVYAIVNNKNLRCYVGGSIHVHNRRRLHFSDLKLQRHRSSKFQKDWNEFGRESFEFVLLEETTPERLLEREQFWLDDMRTAELGYNCNHIALPGRVGRPHTEETRAKIRAKRALQTNIKSGNQRLGKKHTPQTIEKMRVSARLRVQKQREAKVG